MKPSLLILWDVDHTLIETGGVGREVFRSAFENATDRPLERMAPVTGRTEPEIFRETAKLHGITYTPDLFDLFARQLAAGYEIRAEELRVRGRALPGAARALDTLAKTSGIVQSLLTGNLRPVAETKLQTFALGRHVDFAAGAYGSDDHVRSRLVKIAQRRAADRYEIAPDATSTVLIGDSPGDIATGLDGGARVIAIASGKTSATELKRAGAVTVLPDLRDTDALLHALLN